MLRREHGDDARRSARGVAIDCADARVRLIAATEGNVQHASDLSVVSVAAESGKQTRILGALNGFADDLWPGVDFGAVSHRRPHLCPSFATVSRHGRIVRSRPAAGVA